MKRWIVLIIGWIAAYFILKYRRQVKEFLGEVSFAEKIFGTGGTDTFIILLGILAFILSVMYFMGTFQTIMQDVLGPLFGKK